jgi:hypothetical protein
MSQAFASSTFPQHSNPFALRALSAVWVAVLLAACGGEGGGDIAANSGSEVVLNAREAVAVQGTLETVKYRLQSVSWSITPLSPGNPPLTLENSQCTTMSRNDMLTPTPATSTSPGGSGGSTVQCSLYIYSETDVSTDMLYRLQLSGLNEAGQQVSYQRNLRLKPNPVPINSIYAVANTTQLRVQPQVSTCQPGNPLVLDAQGLELDESITFYKWRVIQGPELNLVGDTTRRLGLITPMVTNPTVLKIQVAASNGPISDQSPALYVATALINVDPAQVTACIPDN